MDSLNPGPIEVFSAGGIVIRQQGGESQILLLKKAGEWVLPKGRIEPGELPSQTAIREVCEECGVNKKDLTPGDEIGSLEFMAHQPVDNFRPRPKRVTYFTIHIRPDAILHPLVGEGFEKARFFELNEAFGNVTYPESKGIILRVIKDIIPCEPIQDLLIAVGGPGRRMGDFHQSKLLADCFGEPFLEYLLDPLIDRFTRIFLLLGHNRVEIEEFINKRHGKSRHGITFIEGGTEGNAKAILKAKDYIAKPFISMDGNVLCRAEAILQLALPHKSVVRLLLSPLDKAKTHLHVQVKDNIIFKLVPRVRDISLSEKRGRLLCCPGIMAIDHRIFGLLPEFGQFNDLDYVVEQIFLRPDSEVDFIEYTDDWYCIHDQNDINSIRQDGEAFFRSLTTSAFV